MTSNLNEKKPDMPLALQALAARMKRKEFNPKIEVPQIIVPVQAAFPVAAAIAKKDEIAEATKHLRIGYRFEDKGIYIGTFQLVDTDEESLGQTFNVFAAPKDLELFRRKGHSYLDAAAEVALRSNWYGHDGVYCGNESTLYSRLKDGSAVGKWVIPTLAILHGKDADEKDVRDMHLFGLQNEGDLKDTFRIDDNAPENNYLNCYWSCTQRKDFEAFHVSFHNNISGCDEIDNPKILLSVRPIRFEPAPQ